MKRSWRFWSLAFVAGSISASCGEEAASPFDAAILDASDRDAGALDANVGGDAGTSGPRVHVGTGQDRFSSLASGAAIEFFVGPQSSGDPIGGFHVWGAVRGERLNPNGTMVSFEVLRRDGMQVLGASAPRRVTLLADGQGSFEAYGFPAVLDDCCLVRARPILLRVHLVDGDQRVLVDEIDLVGADVCRGPSGNDVCL